MDATLALLRAAIRADPGFYPAHYSYIQTMRQAGEARRVRAEYARLAAESPTPLHRCLAIISRAPLGYPQASHEALTELDRRGEGGACTAVGLVEGSGLTPPGAWAGWSRRIRLRALQAAPELASPWRIHALMLDHDGDYAGAEAALRRGIARQRAPLERVTLHLILAGVLQHRGAASRAGALRRAVLAAAERDGRHGVLVMAMDPAANGAPPEEAPGLRREQIRLEAGVQGAWPWELIHSVLLGSALSDGGEPAAALAPLDRAVTLADSVESPQLSMVARRIRGRVLAKMGRLAEAERDLRLAVAAGESLDEPYELAEAYHNLMHVYEGAGRFDDALATAARFVALTRPLRHAQPRVISLRDTGIIAWKAGRNATAAAAFGEMVRVIDGQDQNHYWAGEFLERQGDYRDAIRYYRRGADAGAPDRSLNLAGLTRSYLALGIADSAAAAARAHDELLVDQLDVPLLPRILVAGGRADEAVDIARRWARHRQRSGHVQATTLAALELAELLMAAGRWREAAEEAGRAAASARGLHLTAELIHAGRLRGSALVRAGDVPVGLRELRAAVALAEARPAAGSLLDARTALAQALDASGSPAAPAAYDAAARSAESQTLNLDLDMDRVRFRERHLAPFDGAIRLLAREPQAPGAAARIIDWSVRRKAAALRLAVPVPRQDRGRGDLTAPDADHALIDYSFLGDRVVAVVMRKDHAAVVTLTQPPDTLRAWAERLRAPMTATYGGRLDLARAAYDLALAHRLYQALLSPLLGSLDGAERLTISPDGPLHRVPFEALVVTPAPAGDYAKARYVIDRWEVSYQPSIAPAAGGEVRIPPHAALLAIGYRVPGLAEELAAIGASWDSPAVRELTGSAATEEALGAQAGRHAVLHFAVHAVADDRDPAASHLRLAAGPTSDGWLHAMEIAALRLDARLVVLSGCETMEGPIFAGEGRMGLARAFLARGTDAVVATDWPVGPTAAAIAEGFYRRLAAGATIAEALRGAKLDLRRRPDTTHPFHWASWSLVTG